MRAELRAAVIATALIVFAGAIGVYVGVRAKQTPTARPSPSTAATVLPTAAPADPADVQRRAFAQPLSSGCATDGAVWIFADGGAAIRFDGRTWTIPDPALRSLASAACRGAAAIAVGREGSILTADEDRRELRADRSGSEDLSAIALLPDGALAVGAAGTILRQGALDWTPIGGAITDDLFGVAASPPEVWAVGGGGVAYRLTTSGWEPTPSGVSVPLRAVAASTTGSVLAAGDAGTVIRWNGRAWSPVATGVSVTLRAAAVVGAATWIVGDRGTILELLGENVRRIDIGSACTLRAVFAQGASVWVIGSDDLRGSAWRITPSGTDRWGTC